MVKFIEFVGEKYPEIIKEFKQNHSKIVESFKDERRKNGGSSE